VKISTKLTTIGLACAAGFASLVAIGWIAGNQTASTMAYVKEASANVAVVEDMTDSQLTLILAAMDAIVDREDGAVAPERMETIRESIRKIREGEPAAREVAAILGRPELMNGFGDNLTTVASAIETDLVKLIESRAPTEDFAAIDDAIDGGGDKLAATLDELSTGGRSYVASYLTDTENQANNNTLILSLSAAAFLLGICGFVAYIGRGIARSLRELQQDMSAVAHGDLNCEIRGIERNDEIALMARNLTDFRQAAVDKIGLEKASEDARTREESARSEREATRIRDGKVLETAIDQLAGGLAKLSSGDLTARIDSTFEGDLERLRQDFNSSVENLAATLGEISDATGAVRGSITEIGSATDDLSRRTEQQAASLEETAAALDQISSTVRSAAERAEEASAMVGAAKTGAENSGSVMRETMTAMEKISESSGQINQIIGVIDEIAFQTNLLALNAGVEAARAGEAGKGFAVVAQEVRELAQRSANAAKEIKELIATSSSQVESGVSLVNRTGSALSEIETQVGRINDHIQSIVTSSREQSTALGEVNSAVNQMDQMTQQNAAMVEQTNAATQGLGEEASRLEKLIGGFRMPGVAAASHAAYASPSAVASVRTVPSSAPAHAPAPANRNAGPRVAEAGKSPAAPSPARALGRKLASAFSSGSPPASPSNQNADNWEEF
jgi:methyl-accepting chemotaxis protein